MTLYHIVSQKELETLTSDNIYSPLSIALEGYTLFQIRSDYANCE